jgi:hypothetical protein
MTNFYLASVETVIPQKAYDYMLLADDVLRHSAVAPCGTAANVFIEISRRMGGQAQFVSFDGHQITEAIADGRKWTVDANLEALIGVSVETLVADVMRIRDAYAHRSAEEIAHYLAVFSNPYIEFGYNELPTSSPGVYLVQSAISIGKFLFPIILILFGVLLILRKRSKMRALV